MSLTQTKQLIVVPIAGRIGAEIQGVQLSGDLDQTVLQKIKEALNEYKVLFFKGQNHLDDASQEKFSKLFGELYAHPTVPPRANYIYELDSEKGREKQKEQAKGVREGDWHTDVTWVPEVPKYSLLRGVTIPKFGGDTVWANTNTAYEDLPDGLRSLADELWAIHSNEFDYSQLLNKRRANDDGGKKERTVFESTVYRTKHPVVHVHPETGKKHLLLGGFVGKFEGYTKKESEKLFSLLHSYMIKLENTVRWKWTEGDLVIWDNLATQHVAIQDYDAHRIVRRVTAGKHVPVNQNNKSGALLYKD
ncbi:TauD/TfdA family dioxygenase [Niallia oryzisoli]|uniref:TauD/TfdA family dioxygenase n=1 Tax=Niallia oryzisoli TaxID=1737571 RepID=A0ABZ2CRJ4_9BACI